jgi:hypothetical protein
MENENHNSYTELASLVSANISGPVKYELIKRAQERLVEGLMRKDSEETHEPAELLA